jgi:hypothetical protein
MRSRSSHLRNVSTDLRARAEAPEPITDPSGVGPFAEAMRELIADLQSIPGSGRATALIPANSAAEPTGPSRHLRLVH